jgi:hypothetical protein
VWPLALAFRITGEVIYFLVDAVVGELKLKGVLGQDDIMCILSNAI